MRLSTVSVIDPNHSGARRLRSGRQRQSSSVGGRSRALVLRPIRRGDSLVRPEVFN